MIDGCYATDGNRIQVGDTLFRVPLPTLRGSHFFENQFNLPATWKKDEAAAGTSDDNPIVLYNVHLDHFTAFLKLRCQV